MTQEEISAAMNMLPDDILEETLSIRDKKRQTGKNRWKWMAAAAFLVFFVGAVIGNILHKNESSVERHTHHNVLYKNEDSGKAKLPMLVIAKEDGLSMGFEGYMAYDATEIVNANPWSRDAGLTTLPVYENQLSYDERYRIKGGDFDKMKELLLDVAERLGLDMDSIEITDDTPDAKTQAAIIEKYSQVEETVPEGCFEPTKVIVKDNGIEIEVDQVMTATISFEPAIALPEEYNFTHHASYEDKAYVAEYLKDAYGDLIHMNHPKVNICGGDYNIYLQQSYSIEFYEDSNDLTEQIINYNFNRTVFYSNDEGKLFLARVFRPDLSKKAGDYPVITLEKAEELLSGGNYITTVPYDMPGLEYAAKVELVYRTGKWEKYFMPYYRFYVELPEREKENGIKTYGAYYVPAIDEAYISNMPVSNSIS